MDRFNLLSTFARVAETLSFTKAGVALGVSRATVSLSIRELETHLGARLLHRTTRSVNLTPEGERYYEHVQEILTKLDASEHLFLTRKPRVSGRLSIDVPTRIARRFIIPALPTLLSQHPELEVHLGASDRAINLIEQGVDAVVRIEPFTLMPSNLPWSQSLGELKAGQQVTFFLNGLWWFSKEHGRWLEPGFVFFARVAGSGGASAIQNTMQNTGTLKADRTGRLQIARSAGEFANPQGDLAVPLAAQQRMRAQWPCDPVVTLDCDHSPFYSMPERLAEALMRIAAGSNASV